MLSCLFLCSVLTIRCTHTAEMRFPLTAGVLLALGAAVIFGPNQNAEEEHEKELVNLQKKYNLPPVESHTESVSDIASGAGASAATSEKAQS